MSTIFEVVEDALTTLGVPFAADVYIVDSADALPDLYLAYTLVSSPPLLAADDLEKERQYRIQVSNFSKAGLVGLPDVDAAMVAAGFIRSDMRQLPREKESGHFVLAQDFILVGDL